jgi:hypothetical protein
VLDNGRMPACDTLAGLKSATGAETLEESLEILTRRASREAP